MFCGGLSIPAGLALANGAGGVFLWFGAAIVAVLLMGVVLLALRRKFRPGSQGQEDRSTFSIDEIERMRSAGQISEDEFKALRRAILSPGEAGYRHNGSLK